MKLQTKIQLFASLFMLIFILAVNTSIYFMFYKISSDTELNWLATSTEDLVEALNKKSDIPKSELLEAYMPNNGMVRIINDNSKALITKTKKYEYTKLTSDFSTKENNYIIREKSEAPVAVIAKPIIWENGDIVMLQVSQQLMALKENMRTLFYVLFFASLLILIPAVLAGGILSKFVLRPITELIHAMKENKQTKTWKKIELGKRKKSRDELYIMEETFNEMIDYLEENFERQEIFVSDASHELKTPISIVKSYAQLLRRRGVENKEIFTEAVGAIESEADRMQKLVEQMLLLAKSEVEFEKEKFNLLGLCQMAIKRFTGAYHREIIFHPQVKEAHILGNKEQLQQVIYILIDNALKYSDREVKLELLTDGTMIIFKVIDYGQGIPEKDLKYIFDRFYRVDKARSRETGGTGLGLPIAKAIAQVHRGELLVESKPGEGTTFTLELPRSQ
ncbi:ATP-binding protein [Virgibacillus soli]